MTTVDLTTDGPCDPKYVHEVADALALSVRVLNHLTRHHEALEYPQDADLLIRQVATAVSRLPQLLDQVTDWLAAEESAGRLRVADGSRFPSSVLAVDVVRLKLDMAARGDAKRLHQALDAAAAVTSDIAGVDQERSEGGGDRG